MLDYKPEDGVQKHEARMQFVKIKQNRRKLVNMDELCDRLLPIYEHLEPGTNEDWMEECDGKVLIVDPYGALTHIMCFHVLLEPGVLLVLLEVIVDAFRLLPTEKLNNMLTRNFLEDISEYLTGEDKAFHKLVLAIYVKCLKYNDSAEIFEELWELFEQHILQYQRELSTEILDRILQLFGVVPSHRFNHKIECQFLDLISRINIKSKEFALQRRLCKTVYNVTQKLRDASEYFMDQFRACASHIFHACGAAGDAEGKIWMIKSERYLNKFSVVADWTMTDEVMQLEDCKDQHLMELILLNLWKMDRTQVSMAEVEEYSFDFKRVTHGPYACHIIAGKINEIISDSDSE